MNVIQALAEMAVPRYLYAYVCGARKKAPTHFPTVTLVHTLRRFRLYGDFKREIA